VVGAPGEVHHPTLRRFFAQQAQSLYLFTQTGQYELVFPLLAYINAINQSANITTHPTITVIEYVTNRRSTHLQLNCVRLGQTVRFTTPQTKSESLKGKIEMFTFYEKLQ